MLACEMVATFDIGCSAVETLYGIGLVVEPSGAAGMAALLAGRVANVSSKRVVIVLTGSNVSPKELDKLVSDNVKK